MGYLGGQLRLADADHVESGLVGPPGNRLFERFVQVIPVEEQYALLSVLLGPGKYAPQDKLPLAGKNGPLEGQLVTRLPAVACGELSTDDTPFAVADKGLFLIIGQDELRIESQKALRLDRLIG